MGECAPSPLRGVERAVGVTLNKNKQIKYHLVTWASKVLYIKNKNNLAGTSVLLNKNNLAGTSVLLTGRRRSSCSGGPVRAQFCTRVGARPIISDEGCT